MSFRRRVARTAFTLVELLVVVGIITLLIALLLPVLGRAREHANRAKCAANLRSVGQALIMYTQTYGVYPGCAAVTEGGGVGVAVWPVRLRLMLGGEQRVFNCPSQGERFEWSYSWTGPTPRATRYYEPFSYVEGERLIDNSTPFSYGYNFWGATGSLGSIPEGTYRGLGFVVSPDPQVCRLSGHLPVNRVRVPAEMIAIADSTADGIWDYNIYTGPDAARTLVPGKNAMGLPARIHGGGANVLFCDGHVQWYLQRDLTWELGSDNDPRSLATRRMWNNNHEPR